MTRGRWLGGMAAALVVMIPAGPAGKILSETPRQETARRTSWKLAQDAIKEGGPRSGIPAFVNWLTAREIYPCDGSSHGSLKTSVARDLLDESFHYSPKTAARLCGPLTRASGSPAMDRALGFWERANPKASTMDPPFPDGAQLGAAFWNAVRLSADPGQGKIVELQVRSGNETVTRRIRITIPAQVRAGSATCGPPKGNGAPAAPGVKDVSLDEFFWVRLNPGERYNGVSCGDFAVLMAFHLVHKVQGRWLWTTFWWDPESREFGAGRPRNLRGAWANYAMDASFDSTSIIFNPWRFEEHGKNCAQCHAEVTAHPDGSAPQRISFDSVTAARAHFK